MPTNPSPPIAPTADFKELLDALVRLEEALGIAAQKNDIVQGRKLRDKADAARKAVEDYVAVLEAELKILRGTNGTQR